MREISYTPEVDRFLTRGPRETPDIPAHHHPQCYVKTKRETEGDEGSGGERKETEREKKRGGGGLGTGSILTVLSIEAVQGTFGTSEVPTTAAGALHTLTYTHTYTLGLLQTSWVRQSKHAASQMTQFFPARGQKTKCRTFQQFEQVCLFIKHKMRALWLHVEFML